MTAKKKIYTKIALTLSAIMLILWCIIGTSTSIAWFKDVSPEVKNTFNMAELDLKVSYKQENGVYTEVDSKTAVFDDEAIYEPGYVQVVYLKVENVGDVPFDYKLAVDVNSVTKAKSVLGNEIYLPDYLKYGVIFGDSEAVLQRETAKLLSQGDFPEETDYYPLNTYSQKDSLTLAPQNGRYIAIIVRMPESVGNAANYRGTTAPEVDLGLTVTASQEGTLQ